MMTVEEYRNDFHNQIAIATKTDENMFPRDIFIAKVTSMLSDADEFDDFRECYYENENSRGWKIAIDGYAFDDADDSCCVFICDYRGQDAVDDAIRQDNISIEFNKVKRFVQESIKSKLYVGMEESTQTYEFSRLLYENFERISKFRFYLLTDAYNRQRVKNLKDESIEGKYVELNVWDITRIFDLETSNTGKESVEIFTERYGCKGIPCVKAVDYKNIKADIESISKDGDNSEQSYSNITYVSYLAVVPGNLLNTLYMEYGSRLLEGNVRSFLSAKGKVNAGIQRTIKHYPEMFFAYNNGIAATATEVDTELTRSGMAITRIKDLQIVNGGQTTASIANTLLTARKNENVSLEKLYVPMKISVLEHAMSEKIIPKISEYSNSQNNVDASDFFSNHPFNIRMEDFSRKIPAPAVHGNQYGQFWFYERARGQYNRDKMGLSAGELKKYQIKYPPNQVIKLVELAKYMVIFEGHPDIVSKGKQAIVKYFVTKLKDKWDDNNKQFNQLYYKKVVALAIIFRDTDQIIKNKNWYLEKKSYKANVIAYTMSIIFDEIRRYHKGYSLDFMRIWNSQEIYDELNNQIADLCDKVYNFITAEDRLTENVTEWCKREGCWKRAQGTDWALTNEFLNSLIPESAIKSEEKTANTDQGLENEVANVTFIIKKGQQYWEQVLEWGKSRMLLSPREIDILRMVGNTRKVMIPSDKQGKIIMDARKKLLDSGMPLDFDN